MNLKRGEFYRAWDYTVFGDDSVCDVLDDLRESSDIVIDMEKCFDEAIESDYIDYEKRTLCFRSAAIMDSVINGK